MNHDVSFPIASRAYGKFSLPVDNLLLFRAAGLLFLVPNIILATSLAPLAGALVLVGSMAALFLLFTAKPAGGILASAVDGHRLVACVVISACALLLGGAMHVFFSVDDWFTRDAVLADLAGNGFPVVYAEAGKTYLLRSPLGFYMGPALVGRAFGLMAAHRARSSKMSSCCRPRSISCPARSGAVLPFRCFSSFTPE